MKDLRLYRFDVTDVDGKEVKIHTFARTYARDIPSAIESVARDLHSSTRGKFSGDIVEEVAIVGVRSDIYKCAFAIEVFRGRVVANTSTVYSREGRCVVRV